MEFLVWMEFLGLQALLANMDRMAERVWRAMLDMVVQSDLRVNEDYQDLVVNLAKMEMTVKQVIRKRLILTQN
jgi:hypothetical protein